MGYFFHFLESKSRGVESYPYLHNPTLLCHLKTPGQDYEADQICNVSNFECIPPSPIKASLTGQSGIVANGDFRKYHNSCHVIVTLVF